MPENDKPSDSHELFQKAMVDKDPDSMVEYAELLGKDNSVLFQDNFEIKGLYTTAASMGHLEALYMTHFFASDAEEQFKILLQCAEQGLKKAQAKIGENFLRGNGVEKDINSALKWWKNALQDLDTYGDRKAHFKILSEISNSLLDALKTDHDYGDMRLHVTSEIKNEMNTINKMLIQAKAQYDQLYSSEGTKVFMDRFISIAGMLQIDEVMRQENDLDSNPKSGYEPTN